MTILGGDNFGRTAQSNGWGIASDGQAWQILTGGIANWAVAGNRGQITGVVNSQVGALGTGTVLNTDMYVQFSASAIADSVALSARMTAYNTGYRARYSNGTFTLLKTVAGAATTLQSVALTLTPGGLYWIHLKVYGTGGSATQQANMWADDASAMTTEPVGWMLSTTDSSLSTAGQYGLVTALAAGTDIVSYDNFIVVNNTPIPDSPYGMTIGLTNKNPPTPYFTNWAALFADCKALNVSWMRFQIKWPLIQLHQSDPVASFAWGPLDDAVAKCNAAGMRILFPVKGVPSWVAQAGVGQQTTTFPDFLPDAASLSTFCGQVATRYNGTTGHGKLDAMEVGNEDWNITFSQAPTLGLHASTYAEYNGTAGVNINVQPARDPYFFANVLPACSSAIRAAYPGCFLVGAAIWWNAHPNSKDFYDAIYKQLSNAASLLDAVNFHYYSNARDPALQGSGTNYGPSIDQEWADIHGALVANGDPNKQIWCTEFGWGINTNGGGSMDCTPAQQATRYQYLMTSCKNSGVVQKIMFFSLNYKTQDSTGLPITEVSSLVQWDIPSQSFIQQPAYLAWQNFTNQYPQWSVAPPPPGFPTVTLPPVTGRDGKNVIVTGRDGIIPAKVVTGRG